MPRDSAQRSVPGEQFLQVVAGREVLAFGREDDDADVVVGIGDIECLVELVEELRILRVRLTGPGERDRGDRTVHVVVDHGEVHRGS